MGARADGLRRSEAFDETEELLGLAGRVADREPVDWPAELDRGPAADRDARRSFLHALEAIEKLGALSTGVELELPAPFEPKQIRAWGHLELLGLLGKGSYGSVHVARDPQLDRLVALKLFRQAGRAERVRRDAQREGRLLARLKHPNIATVYGFDERDGELGLWMELVRGQTLADRVREQGPMGALEAALAGVEICRALAAAHAEGILHRDVKAQNVVREEGGRLVLVDFGLGLEDARAEGAKPSGTPLYLAPEVVAGAAPSARSDLYALGVLLYHLVTGAFPIDAETPEELVAKLARGDRRPLRDRRPDLPEAFVGTVERALAHSPRDRFASAGELERALLAVVAATRPSEGRSLRSRAVSIGAGVALLIVAAVAAVRFLPRFGMLAGASDLTPRRLTAGAGWEGEPALSPDGTLVAYAAADEGDQLDLWLVDSRGGEPLRLTDDAADDRWPAWLPDGSGLLFESARGGSRAIWRVARLGGPPIFVVGDAGEPAVSPDGKRLAVAALDANGVQRIAVMSLGSPGGLREITGAETGHWSHHAPAWSPDGRSIAFVDLGNLWVVGVDGSRPRALTTDGAGAASPAWSADGRFVYYGSPREGTEAVWRVPVQGGTSERVTLGTSAERHPRLSRDGSRLAYSTFEDRVELAVADLASGRILGRILSNGLELFPALSPGPPALAFVTTRRGSVELRISTLEEGRIVGGSRPLVATSGVAPSHPTFSPDGRWIAYQRRAGSARDIYVVPAAGGAEKPLLASPDAELSPAWSPAGGELAFVRQRSGRYELWTVPMRGESTVGEPKRVGEMSVSPLTIAWSPNGKRLAVTAVEADGSSNLWLLDASGGSEARRTAGPGARRAVWLDADRLAVSARWNGRAYSMRFVDTRTGTVSEPATPLDLGGSSMAGYDLDLSPDRRLVAFTHGATAGDVWMLEAGRGTF